MRQLIAKEKPPTNIWDLKHLDGGIIDLEFIAQYAILSGAVIWQPGAGTGDILARTGEVLCSPDEVEMLKKGFQLYTDLNQIIRLCVREPLQPDDMPPALSDLLQRAAGEPEISRVENLVQVRAATIMPLFSRLLT